MLSCQWKTIFWNRLFNLTKHKRKQTLCVLKWIRAGLTLICGVEMGLKMYVCEGGRWGDFTFTVSSISFKACSTRALVRALGRLTNSINVTAITAVRTWICWNPHKSFKVTATTTTLKKQQRPPAKCVHQNSVHALDVGGKYKNTSKRCEMNTWVN